MATAPQTAPEMPQEGANPYADPNTMAVYDEMRKNVSPKEFGDQVLAGAEQVDPQEVAKFKATLDQIQLPPEALDLLNNMVDEILANPENYAEIRAKYKEMGAPDEILPEQFDAHFFTALNMAVDQMIGAPAGEQAFAKGGIAELKPVSKAIADYGRNGDTMLAHITPAEARMLRRKGGSGTINPKTGLPEYFNLFKEIGNAFKAVGNAVKDFAKSSVGRIVTTVALGFFLGPAAAGLLGATSTAAVAAISGFVGSAGSTLLAGGNLSQALKAGAVGGLTAGAGAGVMGGSEAFQAGSYTGPTTIGGQYDRLVGPATAPPMTAPPAEVPVETINPLERQYATPAEIARVEGMNPANASDQTLARQNLWNKTPVGFQETPAGAAEQVFTAPPTSVAPPVTVSPVDATAGAPTANTAGLANAPVAPPSASATTAATGNAIAPPIANPMDATQFEGSLAKPLTAPPATVAPPAETSLFDSAKDFYNKNISPSGIQQAGMPAAQEAGAKAVTDLTARIPDATPAMKEAAYQNAFKAASPGILSTYAPMTAVGIGAIGAFGGFSPRTMPESALSKTLKGGPGSAEALMKENPYRFYVQGLPGVTYYGGSLRPPTPMATGGIVDAMPAHYAIGGGVDQQLYDAYRAGDSAKVNQIIKANNVTANEIQTRFNLTPADMAWIDNQAGVDYYTPPANTTTTNTSNAATVNAQGVPYSAADTAMYNAFRAGDYNLLNGLLKTYNTTPEYLKTKFGLTDADISWITSRGVSFGSGIPLKAAADTTTGSFSNQPGFVLTAGGVKTLPKTTVGGTQVATGTGVFPAVDDLQLAAGMDRNGITPQKMAVASGLGLPEVQARYWNAKNEAILGNYNVAPETGIRTPIAPRAPVAQPYNNSLGLTSGLSPTGPLGEYSTRAVAPAVPDTVAGGITTIPDVNYTLPGVQRAMPALMQNQPTTSVPSKFMNVGGIASLGSGGYPRRTGQIEGPGTETSDSIPAMLSDGEFVMTAKAVRGAGKGDRRAGAKRMYALMHQLEQNAARG